MSTPEVFSGTFTKNLVNHARAQFGDFTYGIPNIRWWGEATTLTVGSFCSIADGVEIYLGGNHRPNFVTTYPFPNLTKNWPGLSDSQLSLHPARVTCGSATMSGWVHRHASCRA
jgi:hypothetical protein